MSGCNHYAEKENDAGNSRRLLIAFAIISIFMVVEVIGGIMSGSLALLADATHMLTDAFALGLAVSAQMLAKRPPDATLHFGYRRFQVLAAFLNGLLLIALLCWIVYEGVTRFLSPSVVDAGLMIWIALAGFCANLLAFFILHRPGEDDVNMRGAMLHVVGDLVASVAAIIAAVVIMQTGWLRIDPLLSLFVAGLIGVFAVNLLRDTGLILLEAAPRNINMNTLREGVIASSDAITGVNQVRIWQITASAPRILLHINVDHCADAPGAMAAAKEYLASAFNIRQSTVQVDIGGVSLDETEDLVPVAKAAVPNAEISQVAPVAAANVAAAGST